MARVQKGERLAALMGIIMELTQAECPCADCMGAGCAQCGQTGADLESLQSIRFAFAKALDVVERAQPHTVRELSSKLRTPR